MTRSCALAALLRVTDDRMFIFLWMNDEDPLIHIFTFKLYTLKQLQMQKSTLNVVLNLNLKCTLNVPLLANVPSSMSFSPVRSIQGIREADGPCYASWFHNHPRLWPGIWYGVSNWPVCSCEESQGRSVLLTRRRNLRHVTQTRLRGSSESTSCGWHHRRDRLPRSRIQSVSCVSIQVINGSRCLHSCSFTTYIWPGLWNWTLRSWECWNLHTHTIQAGIDLVRSGPLCILFSARTAHLGRSI